MPGALARKPKWLGFYASLLEYVNISENKGYPGARPCHTFALRALRQMSHWPGVRQRPRAFKRKSGGPLSGGSWYPQDSLPADPPTLGSSSQPLVRKETTAMREMCSVFPFNSILSDMHPTIIYGASTMCQASCWVYRDWDRYASTLVAKTSQTDAHQSGHYK